MLSDVEDIDQQPEMMYFCYNIHGFLLVSQEKENEKGFFIYINLNFIYSSTLIKAVPYEIMK